MRNSSWHLGFGSAGDLLGAKRLLPHFQSLLDELCHVQTTAATLRPALPETQYVAELGPVENRRPPLCRCQPFVDHPAAQAQPSSSLWHPLQCSSAEQLPRPVLSQSAGPSLRTPPGP